MNYRWPLMQNNVSREDLDAVIQLLQSDDPRLTQGKYVREFEQRFSEWLGVKHSVFVNSGASANLVTMFALKEMRGRGKVVVPAVTWSSDIASVLHAGHEPVFVDVDRRTLGMDEGKAADAVDAYEPLLAVFMTHCMGYSAFSNVPPGPFPSSVRISRRPSHPCLIEDCCESIGATIGCKKLGTFGLASNFSLYYCHHMTTVEGGMVCTDDSDFSEVVRALRGHGMTRETQTWKSQYRDGYPDLSPDFTFALAGFNVRNTEIGATLGLSQLKRLDENIQRRNENLQAFLGHLDADLYQTDFAVEGCSSYGLTLVLAHADLDLRDRVEHLLHGMEVEFRRGVAGGGNQLRQPYLKRIYGPDFHKQFPVAEHLHHYGWCVGNRPDLERVNILLLCERLNGLRKPA